MGKVLMNINSTFAHELCASNHEARTGIDKLVLTTKDFRIADVRQSKLTIQPNKIDYSKESHADGLLFMDSTGTAIHGAKAHHNHELFQIDIGYTGLKITTNPSKPYHPYFTCSNIEELKHRNEEAFRYIYNEMRIDANFEQMNISRLDATRTEAMKHNCIAYQPILKSLKIPRAKMQKTYPDGYMSSNKQTSFVCYNKGAEIRQDKARLFWLESHPELNQDNLLRMEMQAKKTEAVRKQFGIQTLSDLYLAGINHIQSNYKHKLLVDIFKAGYTTEQASFSFESHADMVLILLELKKQYPSKYMQKFYRLQNFMMDADWSITEAVLKDAHLHRNTIAKHRNEYIELRNMARFLYSKPSKNLYTELVSKFAS